MTNPPTPSAEWDAMTDQQKIEWLATKVMGWEKRETENAFWFVAGELKMHKAFTEYAWDEKMKPYQVWNPLTDWNHWRQVEEKVMEDEELESAYANILSQFIVPDDTPLMVGFETHLHCFMKADLPTRCRALLSAIDALKNND